LNITKQKGLITELNCELAFSNLGILISKPITEDSRYDYIADLGNKFIKIQCKTSSVSQDGDSISFSTRSTRSNTQENVIRSYTKEEIDYFYTCYNNKSYLVPVEECSSSKTLRFIPPKNNSPNYSKAEDYEIKAILSTRENYNDFQENIVHIKTTKQTKNHCKNCNKEICYKATYCPECKSLMERVVERPSREELKDLIRSTPFVTIAKDFSVTDNAIRKWCDSYNLPKKKSEINKYSDEQWEEI